MSYAVSMPAPITTMDEFAANFWRRGERVGDCLIWQGARTPKGYGRGRSRIVGGMYIASRMAYQLAYGEVPEGKLVLHTCDRPSCIEPTHLWLGTQQDNIKDCVEKGRHVSGFLGNTSRRKLTEDQVRKIRARWAAGGVLQRDLAEEYGVQPVTISHLLSGRTYSSVR